MVFMNASQFILNGLTEPAFSLHLLFSAVMKLAIPQVSSPFVLGADMAGFICYLLSSICQMEPLMIRIIEAKAKLIDTY